MTHAQLTRVIAGAIIGLAFVAMSLTLVLHAPVAEPREVELRTPTRTLVEP